MKFSIITVCRNAEKTIERTILSFKEQTIDRKLVEFIVVDGASTDGTLGILLKHQKDIDVLISEPDKGIYDAMNKGVAQATGDFIYFLNADDCFASADVLSAVEKYTDGVDIVFGPVLFRGAEKLRLSSFPRLNLYRVFFAAFCHPGIFASKELFKKCGGFDLNYKIVGDQDWVFRALLTSPKCCRVDMPISIFSVDGVSSVLREETELESLKFRESLHLPKFIYIFIRIEKIFRGLIRFFMLRKLFESWVSFLICRSLR